MNIKKLSKAIQDYIIDGCAYIAIYKNGRSWDYEILIDSDYEEDLQNDKELKELYNIDKNVIVVNGYNDNFGTNSITDIEYRIKYNYENSIGKIYFDNVINDDIEDNSIQSVLNKIDAGIITYPKLRKNKGYYGKEVELFLLDENKIGTEYNGLFSSLRKGIEKLSKLNLKGRYYVWIKWQSNTRNQWYIPIDF